MIQGARYVHTNLVARDWRALTTFYSSVFNCVVVPPERDFSGPVLEAGTGVQGAAIRGVHVRLPGCGPDGPTLEIFSYSRRADGPAPAVNRPGLGPIASAVPSLPEPRAQVRAAGGRRGGEIGPL